MSGLSERECTADARIGGALRLKSASCRGIAMNVIIAPFQTGQAGETEQAQQAPLSFIAIVIVISFDRHSRVRGRGLRKRGRCGEPKAKDCSCENQFVVRCHLSLPVRCPTTTTEQLLLPKVSGDRPEELDCALTAVTTVAETLALSALGAMSAMGRERTPAPRADSPERLRGATAPSSVG